MQHVKYKDKDKDQPMYKQGRLGRTEFITKKHSKSIKKESSNRHTELKLLLYKVRV